MAQEFMPPGSSFIKEHLRDEDRSLLDDLAEAQRRARAAREEAQRLIEEEKEWQHIQDELLQHSREEEGMWDEVQQAAARYQANRRQHLHRSTDEEEWRAAQEAAEEAARNAHTEEWLHARAQARERARQHQHEASEQMNADMHIRREQWEQWSATFMPRREQHAAMVAAEQEMRIRMIEEHEQKWKSIEDRAEISIDQIPFPEPDQIRGMIEGSGENDQASLDVTLKKLLKRWHPDKFTQRFGKKLKEIEKEKILVKVKETFQIVQEQKV